MGRLLFKLTVIALFALVAMVLTRMAIGIPRGSSLTHEAGVWTGLAMDLRDGLFYRPIFSDVGYGGTRYSPLHILLHAALMKVGLAPIPAGFVLSLAAAGGLVTATYALARAHGVDRHIALAAMATMLGASCVNWGLLNIRSDFLAAALNMVGLVIVARALNGRPRPVVWIALAALAFALAICTKVTSIAGVTAAVVALALNHRWQQGAIVGVATAAVTAVVYAIANWASDGRLMDNFRACAAGGGGLAEALQMPSRLGYVLLFSDPVATVIALLALIVAVINLRASWRELPTIALTVTALCTAAIYMTPGTAENHLVDLVAISVAFLAASVAQRRFDLRSAQVAVVTLCAVALFWSGPRLIRDREHRNDNIRGFAEGLQLPFDRPIFSDSAIVPVLFDQRPFVLDDFMFPIVAKRHPQMTTDLYARLDRSEFPMAVFRWDPLGKGRARIYGEAFRDHLRNGYEFWDRRAGHYIYRPKKQGDSPPK